MTANEHDGRKPPGLSWESWIEQQIRDGMNRGLFENLPGAGRPLEGMDAAASTGSSGRDEDWWLKAKLRSERLSYLPPTLAVRKELEEALAAIDNAAQESTVRRIVVDINARIRAVNRRGAEGPPSTMMPLDEEEMVERWRSRHER